MYRLFTLHEATEMIPTVDGLLGEMQSATQELLAARQTLGRTPALSIEQRNAAQEIAFLQGQLYTVKAELDRLGVHLKDVESGVVDFPSQLGAEVICLSWEKGQSEITHYHRLGDSSTKLLPNSTSSGGGADA